MPEPKMKITRAGFGGLSLTPFGRSAPLNAFARVVLDGERHDELIKPEPDSTPLLPGSKICGSFVLC
jgi:hypothetical protein